ncbi:MAG: hypothetical protein ACRDYX_12605, partial [Egibacteraceae bacterium]
MAEVTPPVVADADRPGETLRVAPGRFGRLRGRVGSVAGILESSWSWRVGGSASHDPPLAAMPFIRPGQDGRRYPDGPGYRAAVT